MSTRQVEFYQMTHPGGGSQWDERLQRYVYKKVSEEYATVSRAAPGSSEEG